MIAGKSVVVTGGSRGIGRGLVERLLQRSPANTVIATTTQEPAAVLQELQRQHPGALVVARLDVTCPESVAAFAAQVQAHTPHVDVLINNAGIYRPSMRRPLLELEPSDFVAAFEANALGPFLVVQQLAKRGLLGRPPPPPPPGASAEGGSEAAAAAAAAAVAAEPAGGQGGGASSAPPPRASLVVNVSSVMASHGDPVVSNVTGGGYAYRASKAALNIIGHALSLDLQDRGVEVVTIHPGYVATDLTGGQGWVTVDESADGILRVLEDDARVLNRRWYAFDGTEVPW